MSDELKTFKISDQVKKNVDGPRANKRGEQLPAASVGFPRLEFLVEQAIPDISGLVARSQQLAEIAEQKGATPKQKNAAKKALSAYIKTRALVEYLLETKQKILNPPPP